MRRFVFETESLKGLRRGDAVLVATFVLIELSPHRLELFAVDRGTDNIGRSAFCRLIVVPVNEHVALVRVVLLETFPYIDQFLDHVAPFGCCPDIERRELQAGIVTELPLPSLRS